MRTRTDNFSPHSNVVVVVIVVVIAKTGRHRLLNLCTDETNTSTLLITWTRIDSNGCSYLVDLSVFSTSFFSQIESQISKIEKVIDCALLTFTYSFSLHTLIVS